MKKIIALASLHSSLLIAGQTGGGGGLGKQLPSDLMVLMTDRLPSVNIAPDILRRAEARLSVEGMESVEMPLEGSSVLVRKLNSSVIDIDFTKRFIAE